MIISFGGFIVAVLIFVICIYILLDRICKCIERCSTAKSYRKFIETQFNKEKEETYGKSGTEKTSKE